MKTIKVEPGTVLNSLSRIELIQLNDDLLLEVTGLNKMLDVRAEQIQGLREANAVLEKENKKWFAESEKAVGLHAENKRLKDKIQRIQSVAESNNDGVICGIIEERAKHE